MTADVGRRLGNQSIPVLDDAPMGHPIDVEPHQGCFSQPREAAMDGDKIAIGQHTYCLVAHVRAIGHELAQPGKTVLHQRRMLDEIRGKAGIQDRDIVPGEERLMHLRNQRPIGLALLICLIRSACLMGATLR